MVKTKIVLHHSAITGDAPQFEQVKAYHNSKWKGHGIAYHWFIEKTGEAINGRPEDSLGYHVGEYNAESIGICLAGDFTTEYPTQEQIATMERLVSGLQGRHNIGDAGIYEHRELRPTSCPVVPLKKILFERRVAELQRQLNVAEKAQKRVTGLRKSALTRFIERVRAMLGLV